MKTRWLFFMLIRYANIRFITAFMVLMLGWASAHAAYCSLRDPIVAIHSLYPEADQHRSIVRTIDRDTRDQVSQRLPFTLHFNELGRHTLYVVQQHDKPLGFVHARSEASDWGLIEIAWAINTNLKIEGLYFQRCRHPACNDGLQKKLLNELKDKSLAEIILLLTPEGHALAPSIALTYQQDKSLVLAIIRSALKTLAVTEYGWQDDIAHLRRMSVVKKWLGNQQSLELLPLTENELKVTQSSVELASSYDFVERSSIEVFRVVAGGTETARLVDATWRLGEQSGDFTWLFSDTGDVIAIEEHHPMPDSNTAQAFANLLDRNVVSTELCANAAEITGNTLFLNAYNRVEGVPDED